MLCLTGLQVGYRRWPLVVASRPASPHIDRLFWPGTASFTLLPFDATGKSSPRWRLGTCAGSRAWKTFSTSLFPVAFSHLSSVFFLCLQNTQLLTKNIDCEQYTHTYSTYRACTQHHHISSREHACLKDCASLCPLNNCHSRVMSHLPLFASSPLISLISQTHTTLLEHDEHLGPDESTPKTPKQSVLKTSSPEELSSIEILEQIRIKSTKDF